MSKDFKNVLYLILICVLFTALTFLIPAISVLFIFIPVYAFLIFFATRFADTSRLTSILASIFAILFWGALTNITFMKIIAQITGSGRYISYILIALIILIIFVTEYLISHDIKKTINITLKSAVWIILAFGISILSVFMTIPLISVLR